MNFTTNQTFTLTTDDQQQLTYTVKDIDESGRLLVHSSLLERAYFVSQEAFVDFLRAIGYKFQKIAYQEQNPTWFIVYNYDVPMGDLCFLSKGGLYDYDCWVYDPCYGDPRKRELKNFRTIEAAKGYIEGHTVDKLAEEYQSGMERCMIGYKPTKYKVYWINSAYYSLEEHETFNQAVKHGKTIGFEFRIELGGMICATWSPLGGLRVMTEYQQWAQDQQYMLAKVGGSYP